MSDKGRGTVISTTSGGSGSAAPTSVLAPGGAASTASPTSGSTSGSASGVKYRHEEIISCISALDEVLAQFDDSSLPYIPTEFETSCGGGADPSLPITGTTAEEHNHRNNNITSQSVSNVIVTHNDNSNAVQTEATIAAVTAPNSSAKSSSSPFLVSGAAGGSSANNNNKLVDQNQNLDWNNTPSPSNTTNGREQREWNKNVNNHGGGGGSSSSSSSSNQNKNSSSHLIHTSHLIQIPMKEQAATMSQSFTSSTSAPVSSTTKQHYQQQSQKGGLTGSPYSQKYSNSNGSNSSGSNSSSKRNNVSTYHSSALSSQNSSATGAKEAASSVVEMNGNGGNGLQNKVTNNSSRHNGSAQKEGKGTADASTAFGGGTYTKGTSHEILIPKITSGSFTRDTSSIGSGKGTITTSSHSSRASIMVPVIESEPDFAPTQQEQGIVVGNVAKIRSQLNMGIFQPSSPPAKQKQAHIPGDMGRDGFVANSEIGGANRQQQQKQQLNGKLGKRVGNSTAGNNNNGTDSISNTGGATYITVSEGKSSLGQRSNSGVPSAVAAMIMISSTCSSKDGGVVKGPQSDDEQWNFPSEKNLPRSLRKTRKTCFLDEGDTGKQGMGSRAESPFCCSESSNNGGMSSSTIEHSSSAADHYNGSSCHNNTKSPRLMPRNKGIIPSSKCEIINKGDGNFALAECSPSSSLGGSVAPTQIWNGQGAAASSSSSPVNVREGRGCSNRKKIYEDVILASQQSSDSRKAPATALPISIIAAQNCGGGSSSSPSSTFTSSSGVSLSVTSGANTFVGEEEASLFAGRKSSEMFSSKPTRNSRQAHAYDLDHHRQTQEQSQGLSSGKPRVRQQIPSPSGTGIPCPKSTFSTGLNENQFIPLVYQDSNQVSCVPSQVTMSSHHSPINRVEIGTEKEHRRDNREFDYEDEEEYMMQGDQNDEVEEDDYDIDDELAQVSSANNSPIKTCHPDSLMRNKSSDTDFEETASDSKVLEKARRAASGKRGHSKKHHNAKHFDGMGPNGSLPNQSQMMRMMMMMKQSNGKNNSVGSSSSSSSRSSSSSGSVSVKSSSSSDNNCGDVFHENIVQDYPTNIFNVASASATAEANETEALRGSLERNGDGERKRLEGDEMVACNGDGGAAGGGDTNTTNGNVADRAGGAVGDSNDGGRRTVTTNGAVVVLRGKRENGRGNLQLSHQAALAAQQQQQHHPNSTLEIDDGYLSMINRNEAPLLWPEEFIENETFSKAEMKRLSVTLNDDDTDVDDEDNNLNSPRRQGANATGENSQIASLIKTTFAGCNNRNSMSSSSNTSGSNTNDHSHQPRRGGRRGERAAGAVAGAATTSTAGRSSTEKTDYFSDDSLEMEGDEDLLLQSTQSGKMPNPHNEQGVTVVRAATSFVIPFHTSENEVQDLLDNLSSSPTKDTRSHPVKKSNSQVSRIPKPAMSNNNQTRRNSNSNATTKNTATGSCSPGRSPPSSSSSAQVRKPCSFFIPFASAETPGNLPAGGGGSDRKLSAAGDSTYVSGLAPNLLSSLRSTSLPSSRRNSGSAAAGGLAVPPAPFPENPKQPVAWNISATTPTVSTTSDDKTRARQDKASSNVDTTYVVTTSSTASKNNNPAPSADHSHRQGACSSSSKSSSSSVTTINNNKANNHFSAADNSSVTVTTTTTSKVMGGDLHSSNDAHEKVVIVDKSNNESSSLVTTATTITCSSNTNPDGGGSLSKRHKFQKQQTFIVSPSSPLLSRGTTTTTLVGRGQRLIDPDSEDQDNPTTAAAPPKMTNLKDKTDNVMRQGGNGSVMMRVNDDNDRLMTTTVTTTKLDDNNCRNPAVTTTTTTVSLNSTVNTNNAAATTIIDPNRVSKGAKSVEESTQEDLNEVLSVWEKLNECTSGKNLGGTFRKTGSELNSGKAKKTATSNIFVVNAESNSGTTSKDQVESVAKVTTTEKGEDGKKAELGGEKVGQDNQNGIQGHDSVSEELESVVKMFLKATEGLLDPEESDGKIGSDNLKFSLLNSPPLEENSSTTKVEDDSQLEDLACSFDDMVNKEPLMTSTPKAQSRSREPKKDEKGSKENSSGNSTGENKRLSFLLVSDPKEKTDGDNAVIEDFNEQPPTFIPDPPPTTSITTLMDGGNVPTLHIIAPPSVTVGDALHPSQQQPHQQHNVLDGKVTLDLLSQRITRNCPSPVENMSVSQFLHNKKNIWAMYDRPYDEDALPTSFPRGYASRSQENLIDAMTHERLTKSFSARGQSSTLPLNCRPPPVQRRTSTFRNMFNKFRKHKTTDTVIPEGPELRDEEAQSITSRETGPSEGKKRGFFSRLFRRSRKH